MVQDGIESFRMMSIARIIHLSLCRYNVDRAYRRFRAYAELMYKLEATWVGLRGDVQQHAQA